jgi:hypothetical protein
VNVDNQIRNIANTYAGDAAAIYIQANCQSVIDRVMMSRNMFRAIGLGGVFLLSRIQGGPPCTDLAAEGTIESFVSTDDRFINFNLLSGSTLGPSALVAGICVGPTFRTCASTGRPTDAQPSI